MSDMPFIRSEEEGNRTFLPVPFTLPDGQQIEVGLERFSVPEILYDPSVPGIDSNIISFTGYISNSVNCLNAEIRKELKSTVVTGGNSCMNGFYDRICREMDLVMNPNTNKMKVINSSESDRNILSWIGGSLLCSINGFDEMWFNKKEYNENGVKYLDKKCP